jgi:hypothetical protein
MIPQLVNAAVINFTEAWETTGTQATTSGELLTNYQEWTYFETLTDSSSALVNTGGVLTFERITGTGTNWQSAGITPTSIGAGPLFDVSSNSLTLTVDAGRGAQASGQNIDNIVGAFIGDVLFLYHPGNATGLHRVSRLNESYEESTNYLGNSDMGFSPGIDGSISNSGLSRLSITISEKDVDEYTFTYSITDLVDLDVYSNSIDILKSNVGALDRAGVQFAGAAVASQGLFTNFSISQIPEPSSVLLVGLGLIVSLRRRR